MYLALLLCAFIDLTLSYNYYVSDTTVFVTSESNIEFVRFLTQGCFPFNNVIKFALALPLLLFLLSWFDIFHEHMQGTPLCFLERFGRTFTLAIPGLFCVSYSISGMTWYTNAPVIYDILSMLQTMIQGSTLIVVCSLFLLTVYLLCGQERVEPRRI
jgi:hypothetical protein